MGVGENELLARLGLPPGFRFYPTDEELMVQYLCRKISGQEFSLRIIGDVDLYKYNPWDLPSKALFGEKEWYFFSPRDRKYPNGSRPNRVAGSGYWKATGTDKVITTKGRKVGIKKALVFYVGKAPKGNKTNWIMHEYRVFTPPLKNGSSRLDEWVLCRIYEKRSSASFFSGIQRKECSFASPSSSSEIEYQFCAANSLNSFQQEDQKPNIENLGSSFPEWAEFGLHPDISAQQPMPQAQLIGTNSYASVGFGGYSATELQQPGFLQENRGMFDPVLSGDPYSFGFRTV